MGIQTTSRTDVIDDKRHRRGSLHLFHQESLFTALGVNNAYDDSSYYDNCTCYFRRMLDGAIFPSFMLTKEALDPIL